MFPHKADVALQRGHVVPFVGVRAASFDKVDAARGHEVPDDAHTGGVGNVHHCQEVIGCGEGHIVAPVDQRPRHSSPTHSLHLTDEGGGRVGRVLVGRIDNGFVRDAVLGDIITDSEQRGPCAVRGGGHQQPAASFMVDLHDARSRIDRWWRHPQKAPPEIELLAARKRDRPAAGGSGSKSVRTVRGEREDSTAYSQAQVVVEPCW